MTEQVPRPDLQGAVLDASDAVRPGLASFWRGIEARFARAFAQSLHADDPQGNSRHEFILAELVPSNAPADSEVAQGSARSLGHGSSHHTGNKT
jgi:hypothetical protein